ncbi:MAG: hypothetical protein AB7F22_08135 [Reyranella sp.]|uniref:hypothetical protein n=1 Tax=Reyranella sp. TaxID=1929291 RepID=UPI003D0FB4A1
MEMPSDRIVRGSLSSAAIARLYPVRVARIARGLLTYAEQGRLNESAAQIDRRWRSGCFNGLEYFHFRFPEQGALMASVLLKERLHRLVPGSTAPATSEEVEAEWRRIAEQRAAVLAWARTNNALMDIVQAYRFERRRGAFSSRAHAEAAKVVQQIDRSIVDPLTHAGVCIEWAEREYRQWFWRCAPDHQVL